MKIAIFASNEGEKALHLYNFFKEGNRVVVDALVTDNPESPLKEFFEREGISVILITDSDDNAREALAEVLAAREIEVIAVDGYDSEIPESVMSRFEEGIVTLSGLHEGPGEVIAASNRRKARLAPPKIETPQPDEAALRSDEEVDSQKREWAEALNIEPPTATDIPQQPLTTPDDLQQSLTTSDNPQQPPTTPDNLHQYPQYPQPQQPQQPQEKMPDTYLVWAIIITIFCCLIPGIVAIIYSSSVSNKYYSGDLEGAKRASRLTQIWIIVSVLAGVIWASLYLPLMLLAS